MKPLVSQLWPQFMADPAFAACFGSVAVEHARMLRAERRVIFTLRSAAPLDRGLCARLLAPPMGADSPCQGEMSRRDKRGREMAEGQRG